MSSRWGSDRVVLCRAGHLPVAMREKKGIVSVRIVDHDMTLIVLGSQARDGRYQSHGVRTMDDSQRNVSNSIDV